MAAAAPLQEPVLWITLVSRRWNKGRDGEQKDTNSLQTPLVRRRKEAAGPLTIKAHLLSLIRRPRLDPL